jgi:hypothetical protein
MMQTDVKGASCPASTATTAYNGRTRLKAIYYSASAATTIDVKDGSTTLRLPGEGILVSTSLVINVGASCTAVAFYG